MSPAWLLDVALLVLATLRGTRLVTTDSIGVWWLHQPLMKRAYKHGQKQPKWARYIEGLECPYCVGWWVGLVGLGALWLAGGPGEAADWWRYGAGALALSWVVGHLAAWLD